MTQYIVYAGHVTDLFCLLGILVATYLDHEFSCSSAIATAKEFAIKLHTKFCNMKSTGRQLIRGFLIKRQGIYLE